MTHKSVSNGTRTMSLFGIIGQPGIVQHMTTSKLEQEIECVAWGRRRSWMIIPSLDNKLWQNKWHFWFKLQTISLNAKYTTHKRKERKRSLFRSCDCNIMVMQFLSDFMDRFLLYEIIRLGFDELQTKDLDLIAKGRSHDCFIDDCCCDESKVRLSALVWEHWIEWEPWFNSSVHPQIKSCQRVRGNFVWRSNYMQLLSDFLSTCVTTWCSSNHETSRATFSM